MQKIIKAFAFMFVFGFSNKLTIGQINSSNSVYKDSLLQALNNNRVFEYKHIGRGYPSSKFKLFEKLYEISDETSLLELTKNKNPIIRSYAFFGLTELNPNKAFKILKKNRWNNNSIYVQNGCLGGLSKVNFLMANILSEKSKDLTPKQKRLIERIENKEFRYSIRLKKKLKKDKHRYRYRKHVDKLKTTYNKTNSKDK